MDLSFWEKDTYFKDIDLLIIGGGIVGLNAARAVKEKNPKWKIVVADRGFLPYGASTRNAGFCCFGSVSELMDDLLIMTESEVFDLVKRRWEGLKRLRSILGDEKLAYKNHGGYELFTENDQSFFLKCKEQLSYFNSKLSEITGEKDMYSLADSQIKNFGFDNVQHLIYNKGEGQIDTGKMMQSLLHHVRNMGVEVLSGIELTAMDIRNNDVELKTNHGFNFTAKKVLVTTNGFAKQLLPELDVQPGRAQVLVTAPILDLKIKGTFHFDKGYYYFRNIGDRVLFGGGRNLDFESEKTTEFGLTEKVQSTLEKILKEIILPKQHFTIEQRWSGIMGLGSTKKTIVKQINEHVFCAVRMGGMGIAIGSLVGEEVAELISK